MTEKTISNSAQPHKINLDELNLVEKLEWLITLQKQQMDIQNNIFVLSLAIERHKTEAQKAECKPEAQTAQPKRV